MKRCPQCNRVETDEALKFCRVDGTTLIAESGPVSGDAGTAKFSSAAVSSEIQTSILPHTTDASVDRLTAPTTVLAPTASPSTTRELTKPKRRLILVVGILLIAAVGASFGLYKVLTRQPRKALSFAAAKITRLTTTGKATQVAISPDGKYVVHVQNEGGQRSLWVRHTVTQSNVQIVEPAAVTYNSLTFSPDGNYIYYNLYSQEFPQNALLQVGTFGGAPKKILENLDVDPISFSPDGSRFVFPRADRGKEFALIIANADGTDQRKLVSHKNPPESIGYPTWSPDGEKVVYLVLNYNSNDETLYEARIADGSTKPLTSQRWFRMSSLAWLSDGSGLLMLATPRQQFVSQIWQVSYPKGEANQLTNDLNDYNGMSLTADSHTLAVVKVERQSNVWVTPSGDASRARPVTSGVGNVGLEVAFSPDGNRIVYSSSASGDKDIWVVNADGSSPKQLTANTRVNGEPSVSPDGHTIVFTSDRSSVPHIWRMNIDGSDPRQLTSGIGDRSPQFSPDGRWVVYRQAFGKAQVWKVPANGGEPVQLNDKGSRHPTVSPDSKLIAYFYSDENTFQRIAVAPFDGGEPLKTFALPATANANVPPRWTADGRAIAYVDTQNGVSNIVSQPLDGGAPKQLTNFTSDRIFWFDFSRDGKQVALSRGTQTSDVILYKDFR